LACIFKRKDGAAAHKGTEILESKPQTSLKKSGRSHAAVAAGCVAGARRRPHCPR
jgi:hypothetical protein